MKKTLLTFLNIFYILGLYAQWSNDPAVNNQVTPDDITSFDGFHYAVSEDGTSYILTLTRFDGNTATLLQIVDKDGNMVLADDYMTISHKRTWSWQTVNDLLWTDRDGNALIVVSDCRNSSADLTYLSYYIYKVSPTGELLWDEEGIDLEAGRSNRLEAWMKMVQLEDGSYVFTWITNDESSISKIYLQRVSQEGELLWENTELGETNVDYSTPFLVNGGNNQVILIYSKGTNMDLYARKIDFDGSSVWSEDLRIYRAGFTLNTLQTIVRVIPDGNGGAFVGWYDDRDWDNIEDVYVAHVKSNGTLGFTGENDGLKVSYSDSRSFRPSLVYNEDEASLYVIWQEQGNSRLAGQKINLSGELLWDPDGKELAPYAASSYSIRNGREGQLAVFYMISYGYTENTEAFIKLIDTKDGEPIWEEEKIFITTAESYKAGLASTLLIDNTYWLLLWQDSRLGDSMSSETLYMQRINFDGTYGEYINSISVETADNKLFKAFPSLIKETTEFVFDNKISGKVDISIYSVSGQKIATAHNGYMNEGMQSVQWNAKKGSCTSGIYIVALTTADRVESTRIVIK